MGTLADLQTRIITETNRDDLSDDLAVQLQTSINDAVGEFENERFWFNETRVVTTFSAGQQYTSLPSGQTIIDQVYAIVGSIENRLIKRSMEYIENLYLLPQIGQPTDWAAFGTQARIWPTPNVDYPGVWLTVSQVTPALDFTNPSTSSNHWTNEGQRLITAQTKLFLYRDVFKDYDAAKAAQDALDKAYADLKGQSNRQMMTGRMRASW